MNVYRIQFGQLTAAGSLALAFAVLAGCASTSNGDKNQDQSVISANVPPLPTGVTLHEDKDIQGVWLSPGFNFGGYDTLYIAPTVFAATQRRNEVDMRAMAMRVLPEQLQEHLGTAGLFTTVTTSTNDVKTGAKCLTMDNTIIEYQKGGGGARYFAGIFGGGEPVIKVRGEIWDGDKLMCVYELRRSGESAGSRMSGAFMSDEEIQRNDIRDLASDLTDFFKRTAGMQ